MSASDGSIDPRNGVELDGVSFAVEYKGNAKPLEHRFRDGVCTFFASDKPNASRKVPYKAYRGAHLLLWLEKSESPLSRAFIIFDKRFQTAMCFGLLASKSGKMSVSIRRGAVNGPYTYETALQFPPDTEALSEGRHQALFAEHWNYNIDGASLQLGLAKGNSTISIKYRDSEHSKLLYCLGPTTRNPVEYAELQHAARDIL